MFSKEYKSLDSHDILDILEQQDSHDILEQQWKLPFPSLESKSMCLHSEFT
jgi:hypothetical protein